MLSFFRQKVDQLVSRGDQHLLPHMREWGHKAERYLIGGLFIWFGLLKMSGELSATSIVAKSVYWFDPSIGVPLLGLWEITMGLLLFFPATLRLALLLFFIRLPGTFLALILNYDACFADGLLVPTIQGQYLLKEFTLVGADLVIGSTVADESKRIKKV